MLFKSIDPQRTAQFDLSLALAKHLPLFSYKNTCEATVSRVLLWEVVVLFSSDYDESEEKKKKSVNYPPTPHLIPTHTSPPYLPSRFSFHASSQSFTIIVFEYVSRSFDPALMPLSKMAVCKLSRYVYLFLLVGAVDKSTASSCEKIDDCSCRKSNGKIMNLKPVDAKPGPR